MKNINEKLLARYFKKEGITIDSNSVNTELLEHPDYPNLNAFSEVFDKINVDNMAVSLEMIDLDEVEYPLIGHFKEGGGRLVLLEKKTDHHISCYDEGRLVDIPHSEFSKRWSGMALLLKRTAESGHAKTLSFQIKRYQNVIGMLGVCLVLFISTLNFTSNDFTNFLPWVISIILSSIGLWVSIALLKLELGENTNLNSKLCKSTEVTDCNQVVNSKKGKLFGQISWSQLGIIIFTGHLLATTYSVLTGNFNQVSNILAVIYLVAIPFSIYGIILQAFIIKKWCTLCLIVHASIFLLAGNYLYFGNLNSHIIYELSSIGVVFLSLIIPFTILNILMSPLIKSKEFPGVKRKLGQFQRDKTLFKIKLSQEMKSPDIPIMYPILIGNPDAPNQIIMVTSPFCGPCNEMHKKLSNLQMQLTDELNIQIVLSIPAKEGHDIFSFVKHFLTITIAGFKDELENAMKTLYGLSARKEGIEKWINDNPIAKEVDEKLLNKKIENHNIWLQRADIKATPTLFFNGHQFPKIYDVDDLKFLI